MVKKWKTFYKRVFGLNVDFANLQIPEKRDDFNWMLIMNPGLGAQALFNKCSEQFKLLELFFFWGNKRHLDVDNYTYFTLCSGSGYSEGFLPNVGWDSERLVVEWGRPDSAYFSLRAREVIF